MARHPFRVLFRCAGFVAIVIFSLLDFLLLVRLPGRHKQYRARAEWLQRWSRRTLRLLGVRVQAHGTPPLRGLLTSNHLSYLDIVVYASLHPVIFVSKSEVRDWPMIGWMTRCAGTLFINRRQRSDVNRMAALFAPVIAQDRVVALFPEGTSTNGRIVLPFRSSLLEPAAANAWLVSPAWIGYSLADGRVEDEVCYWRDLSFGPHLFNLFAKESITARVAFGTPLPSGLDRKEMARALHAAICRLAADHGHTLEDSPAVIAEIARLADAARGSAT